MRPIGEILQELGFNKDAPLETQKAFFRHLVRHAEASCPPKPNYQTKAKDDSVTESSEQLSFDPKILGVIAK